MNWKENIDFRNEMFNKMKCECKLFLIKLGKIYGKKEILDVILTLCNEILKSWDEVVNLCVEHLNIYIEFLNIWDE